VIKDTIAIFTAVLHGDWAAAWEGMKTLFSDFLYGIVSIFVELVEPFHEQWMITWEAIKTWFS